jgi:hypothetical protein
MATKTRDDDKKTVDLPPYGPRNPDPLTDQPGSHPIETGIGAAIGGAASGLAVGTLTAGPVGAVVGAIVGGAAVGGLAGKGIGELIDPTLEDNWIREWLHGKPEQPTEENITAQRRAFRFGTMASKQYPGKMFREVDDTLKASWTATETVPWTRVKDSVRAGFERCATTACPTGNCGVH